ncbi:MAG: type IIA DNA topoisomerase subunit B [Bacteroidales bacterium]|nr:type IIA DNA topoisomerase subunit B [Bacteroidales bacterium]
MSDNHEELPVNDDDLFDLAEDRVEGTAEYTEDDVQTLDWKEHIQVRPGMYIGGTGDGTKAEDGLYVLLKEVLDNSIDEYMMGFGKQIIVDVDAKSASVRDFGRGIPLGALVDVVSKINTGAKYGTGAFKKVGGLNGVGVKAVNALSTFFEVVAYRDGKMKRAVFSMGNLVEQSEISDTDEPNGTLVRFTPSEAIFRNYEYRPEFIEPLVRNYTYLNTGLSIIYNGKRYFSRHGLLDLLEANMTQEKPLYPIIHLKGQDIEVALTHVNQYGDEYYSFVNSQHTSQGGTHLAAFKEAVSKTLKEYFGKNLDPADIRNGMVAAIAIKVEDPEFQSQTKTRLDSRDMGADGPSVAKFVGDFIRKELDNYLHRHLEDAEVMLKKIQDSERDRKAMSGVQKKARETAKKVSLYNRKLNDCRVHLSDARGSQEKKDASSIFITEGDSAGGSIEKVRDVETQAVFKLRGKPLNTYGATKKELYTNEEFALLQAALNIEDGIESLRYNKVIIATDADVDGMHIRLLMLTFFLQYFPDLIKKGHVYVLQTPLFRVRNKKTAKRNARARKSENTDDTVYCYTDQERIAAIERFGDNAEITRFKGLGEISPDEFRGFIGPEMRLDRVSLRKEDGYAEVLEFYMGKNTMERQNFIIDNLVIEDDSNIDH